jgi:hypothetical protein
MSRSSGSEESERGEGDGCSGVGPTNGEGFVPSFRGSGAVEGGTVLKYDGLPSTSSAYAWSICFCRVVSDL